MESKVCYGCGDTKPLDLFAKNKQSRGGRENQCQACRTATINTRRRENKLKAIGYLGGACAHCGGDFPAAVYDFHHVDPTAKEADPGSLMGRRWERIVEELDKCILLCANCHRIEHMKEEK